MIAIYPKYSTSIFKQMYAQYYFDQILVTYHGHSAIKEIRVNTKLHGFSKRV